MVKTAVTYSGAGGCGRYLHALEQMSHNTDSQSRTDRTTWEGCTFDRVREKRGKPVKPPCRAPPTGPASWAGSSSFSWPSPSLYPYVENEKRGAAGNPARVECGAREVAVQTEQSRGFFQVPTAGQSPNFRPRPCVHIQGSPRPHTTSHCCGYCALAPPAHSLAMQPCALPAPTTSLCGCRWLHVLVVQTSNAPRNGLLVLLLGPAALVLYLLYWRHLKNHLSADVILRIFAGGFLPGGAPPFTHAQYPSCSISLLCSSNVGPTLRPVQVALPLLPLRCSVRAPTCPCISMLASALGGEGAPGFMWGVSAGVCMFSLLNCLYALVCPPPLHHPSVLGIQLWLP